MRSPKGSVVRFALTGALALAVASPVALSSQPVAAKKKKDALELAMDVKSFTLDNGLRVFVLEDHSTPAFNISLLYDVGSIDEVQGKTGLAHFFEHMMFQGSENLGDNMIAEYTERAGGNLNAGTSFDQTLYYHNIPSNYLDMVLWGEADRMTGLDMTQETFESQRAAVISEKDRSENAPFAKAIQWEFIPDLMPESPYTHPPIGTEEDLEAMTLEDAQDFFNRYYTPNNCVISIVGDVEFEQVKQRVQHYFGGIPKGPERTPTSGIKKAEERPRQKIEKKVTDDRAQQTAYLAGWRAVDDGHPDRPALDLLATILFTGESARVPKILTDEKKLTVVAFGTNFVFRHDGAVFLQIIPKPDSSQDEIKKVIQDEIAKVAKKGVSKKELEKATNAQIMNTVSTLASNQGRATSIAQGAAFYGEPKRVITDLDKYRDVTSKDIKRVAEQYLDENWVWYELAPK